MEEAKWGWVGPALGIVFVALFVAISIIFGEGVDASEKTAEEVVDYYQDHESEQIVASIMVAFASASLLFFAGYLRRELYRAEGSDGWLPTVAWGGAVVFAAAASISATIHFALADLADDTDVVDPLVFQTLNAFDWDNFLFFAVGLGTLVLATGISAIRHGSLPRWLGWLAVVVGIGFFTPAIFPVGFIGGPLVILLISIVLLVRSRGGQRRLGDTAMRE